MRRNPAQLLPDPWLPPGPYVDSQVLQTPTWQSGGPSTADEAIYIPVVMPCAATLYSLSFRGTNATGNYDMGVYLDNYSRYAAKGSTAMANAKQDLTFSDLRIGAGETVIAAFVFSSTAARLMLATGLIRSLGLAGIGQEASALPLPATATPLPASTWANIPAFSFGVR